MSVHELDRLIAVAHASSLTMIELSGRNGLRPAEARALHWEDVDLTEGLVSITGQNNRDNEQAEVKRANNAARTIYLDRRSANHLAQLYDQ